MEVGTYVMGSGEVTRIGELAGCEPGEWVCGDMEVGCISNGSEKIGKVEK